MFITIYTGNIGVICYFQGLFCEQKGHKLILNIVYRIPLDKTINFKKTINSTFYYYALGKIMN